jgi:hypothetical protein
MPTRVEVFDPGKTTLLDFAAGANAVYVAESTSIQPTATLVVASVSAAAAAVITSVAHGLLTDNAVKIAGATGDWAALNGTRIITVLTADTFSVAVNSSGFAATFNGVITTTAPRTSASCWRISKNYYDGSSNLVRSSLANGTAEETQVYDSRSTLSYQ